MPGSMAYRRVSQLAVAIASVAVAVVLIRLGLGLVPERAVAEQWDIVAQWLFTWGLIGTTSLAATVLSIFLLWRSYSSE